MKWYVIHTYTGFEEVVAKQIRQRVEKEGLEGKLGGIIIPKETVIEIKNGKKLISSKNPYPGYVFIQLDLQDKENGDKLWFTVRTTPRVTGFLGTRTSPKPVSDEEVERIKERMVESKDKPKHKQTFQKGDAIKIIDGPFYNFTGVVEEIDPNKQMLKVMVTIFGRQTPVELNFSQVEKL